ncbi:hypothetical protein, partial [Sphingomonas sp. Leaf62]|uniref:hypothetical protein n=1 Tax=Sphingomonas sp. Leaf62 TaxID=1736228 RepID=UPI001F350B3B
MIVTLDNGSTIALGTTETAATIAITDYSRRVTDDFGVTTVVRRGFSRRMSLRFALPFEEAGRVQSRLAELRATPALWVADDRWRALSVRGLLKEFEIDLAVPPQSYCSLSVDGLAESEVRADPGGDPAPEGMVSALKMVRPLAMTDAVLTATSVAENDAPAWVSTTTYTDGAKVRVGHRVFESLAGGNVGNDPTGSVGKWIDIGPTNRWAMFDQALGSATTAAAPIVVTLATGTANTIALLDVAGTTVHVQAQGYDRTLAIGTAAMVFSDLPGGSVTVTIAGGGSVSVGTLLVGHTVALGVTEASPTAGITDYSRKEVDDFGEVTIVQRAWSKRMQASARIRSDAVDTVFDRIAGVRATPTLWIGDEGNEALTIYGFFKEASIEVGEATSKLSLQIDGLSRAAKLSPIGGSGPVAWPDITDPDGTKPKDGADKTSENTSKDTSAVGGRPAHAVLALVDEINDVVIPAVNLAVATANDRITAARQDADRAAADANARIDAADRVLEDAVRDFAAEASRAQGADEALTRRIDSIVAESGGYDDRDLRAMIATEKTVRADEDRALGREVATVAASVKDGDDAVRADVKVTTDALARSDEAFAQRAEVIEASLGTVDSRIAAKAEQITTAYADADRALTRRIDSIVAEGGYDDRDVRAEIKRVDTTAIDRDAAVGRRVDTVEATFSTGGGNMVPNSDLVTTDGWSTGVHAPGGPLNAPPYFGLNAAGEPYHPVGENVLSILQYGPPNGGDGSAYLEWASATFPVTAGHYLQFSALVNCHRAQVTAFLAFRDAAGGYLTAIPSPIVGPIENLGNSLSFYARAGIVAARVPDGAISAYLILRKLDTIRDYTDSYAWFLRPYVGAVREGQTTWNPYSVGRASPVLLGTVARVKDTTDALARADAAFAERAQSIEASLGTVDARIGAKAEEVTRAYADADRALGSRATTLEAAASATSTSIVFNDNFNFWPDGATLPARWFLWSTSGNFRTNRLAPGRGGGQFCVQTLNDTAEVDSGFFQTIYTAGAGKWVIEVTAGFDSSGARGAGVTLHGVWNIDFCSDADINGLIGDRPGETRSWTKMVDLDGRDQINVHAMHGWSGFGRGMAAKYMVWHRLALRPATDGEIKAGKADAALNAPGGVLARIATSENVLADLPNRYAAASRTATLEAQMSRQQPSALNQYTSDVNDRITYVDATVNARIKSSEDVIADLPNRYAAASRTEALEAQVNLGTDSGLKRVLAAQIETRATAIADEKAGAVAQTVQTLRGEYNGTAATVQQQAAVLAAADGRTGVYWEVVGTTGDGSTRVRLSKSNGQRGVFYVDADMIVDGTLLVNG